MGATKAFGTLLKRGDGATPENFTTVANAKDITGPGMKPSFEDVTTHSSAAAGKFMEWLPTLIDGGDVKCDILWDPTDVTHQGLHTDQTGQVKRNFQLVFPTNPTKTATFAAYVDQFEFKSPVKGAVARALSLKVSGPVTIT
jgi:hypothetical protein